MKTKIRLVKALVRHNGKYLLLQKAEDKFFPENVGKWECSGGVIEKGETSRKTIIREVKKETGLKFKIIKKLPTLKMTDKKYDSKCDIYLIETKSEDVKICSGHSDFQWLASEEIKKISLVLYASLLLEFFNNPERYLR